MPHGNATKKRANPKKKGKNGRPSGAPAGRDDDIGNTRINATTSTAKSHRMADACRVASAAQFLSADFQRQHDVNDRKPLSSLDNAQDFLYARYKKSTQRIKDALQSMVPPEIFQTDNVSALMDATDYIVEHDLKVDAALLIDLKVSIRVRQKLADEKYSGGDEGHLYFVAVLVYCWSHLRRASGCTPKARGETPSSLHNQFEKLSTGDDDDERSDDYCDDDETDLPVGPQERPTETEQSRSSIKELLSGSSRTNCELFVLTLDGLMLLQSFNFSRLVKESTLTQTLSEYHTTMVLPLIKSSVAANLAIQQVESLEQMFILDNPHLKTVYRVFANLILVDYIRGLTAIVVQKSPIASQFSEKDAVEFLGDALECWFRHPSDPYSKSKSLVRDFLDRWKFPDDETVVVGRTELNVQEVFDRMEQLVEIEAPLDPNASELVNELCEIHGMKSHSWLRGTFIGKDRAMTHTIRLLQQMSYSIHKIKKLDGHATVNEGYCGRTSWSDLEKPVSRIQTNMFGVIMPSFINLCTDGALALDFPFKDKLLSGLVQIKTFVDHPERPVSWSLAFAVHTILTSIFETQESNHLEFMAEAAEFSFDHYFEQLERLEILELSTIPGQPPLVAYNLKQMQHLKWLVEPPVQQTQEHNRLAIWNPYCAGSFLSYIAYQANLVGGTTLIDAVGQLRMTLHLFNALKQVQAIRTGNIGPLDRIFEAFKGCKSIWHGSLPVKNQFQACWSIAFETKPAARGHRAQSTCASRGKSTAPRAIDRFDIAHLSKSFRRICLCDVSDVPSSIGKKLRKGLKDDVCQHVDAMLDTFRAMEDEQVLLATNLARLGFYMNEFCIALFDELGWMPAVEQIVRDTSALVNRSRGKGNDLQYLREASDDFRKYLVMSHMFGEKVMAALDAGDTLVASRCAEIMVEYFNDVEAEALMWFTPTGPNES